MSNLPSLTHANRHAPGGPDQIAGVLPWHFVAKNSAYTGGATAADNDFVEADTSTAGFTVPLPVAPRAGALVAVKKISSDTNTLTIAAGGGGTIDGQSTLTTVTQWAGLLLEHKGSNVWRVAASMTTTGPAGANGNTVLNGSGAPSSGTGNNGDFYIDTTAQAIYGPKTSGAWGSSTALRGTNGANGAISVVQDEGSALTVRSTINFVGAGVTATDDSANSRTLITIPGGGGSGVKIPPQAPSGYWFSPCPYIGTGSGTAYTAGQIEFSPLLISASLTVTDIMFKISVGVAGSTHRVGIYGDTNGLPGSLVVDLGSVATATAALLGYTGLTQALAPGNYWMAIVQQGTGVSTLWKGGQLPLILDSRASGQFVLDASPPVAYNSSATTFTGALPSTAPTLATATSTFAARFALKAA